MFIILNLAFFFVIAFFVYNSGTRYSIYQESYAKQIALVIDEARPDMSILMNVTDALDLAKKENKPLDQIFKLDDNTKRISVSLGKGSYSYQYFSNYHVDLNFDNSGLITINVQK